MMKAILYAIAVSALVASPALAQETKKMDGGEKMETKASEEGVESIAEEAADAPAEIPEALEGDEPQTEPMTD